MDNISAYRSCTSMETSMVWPYLYHEEAGFARTRWFSGRCKRATKVKENMAHRHCRVEGASGRRRLKRTWLTDIAGWKVQAGEEG